MMVIARIIAVAVPVVRICLRHINNKYAYHENRDHRRNY